MSHVVGAGNTANSGHVAGKRLGIKKYAGEAVKGGNIIIRQKGSVYHAGRNTYQSRNFSIHAKSDGFVAFRRMTGFKRGKFFVDVVESL